MLHSYTLFRVYLYTCVTREEHIPAIYTEKYTRIWGKYHWFCYVYSVKGLQNFRRTSLP
jgi:hypothetical protein